MHRTEKDGDREKEERKEREQIEREIAVGLTERKQQNWQGSHHPHSTGPPRADRGSWLFQSVNSNYRYVYRCMWYSVLYAFRLYMERMVHVCPCLCVQCTRVCVHVDECMHVLCFVCLREKEREKKEARKKGEIQKKLDT